jgi:superfamily I DNA/RNA helicase
VKLPSYQDLSKEQDKINDLPLDESYLIVGPPGTGKTVMALYRAKMLTSQQKAVSVLMHSRLLSQYTGDAAEELGVDGSVTTFHRWFYGFWLGAFRQRYPQIAKFDPDWEIILQQLNLKPPSQGSLEHLLVDEAQDMAPGFYLIARRISRAITAFADENQRLRPTNSTLDQIKAYAGLDKIHRLTRNYRNTKEIAALAAHFFTGLRSGIAEPPTRGGNIPVMTHHKSIDEWAEFVVRYEKAHNDLDIGILVPDMRTRSALARVLEGRTKIAVQVFKGGKGARAEELDFGEPGIKLLCYASAKGLEFDTVFLPELQACTLDIASPEFKMLFYVLISRARTELFLSYSGAGEPQILKAFPKGLLEWRNA